MRRIHRLFLLTAMTFVFALAMTTTLRATTDPLPKDVHGQADLHGQTPVQFLEFLKKQENVSYVFWRPLKHWITEKDIAPLLALIDSKKPCSSVALALSSYSATSPSTVGLEALFMLEGFRKGEYPPGLNSVRFGDAKSNAELIAWCRSKVRP